MPGCYQMEPKRPTVSQFQEKPPIPYGVMACKGGISESVLTEETASFGFVQTYKALRQNLPRGGRIDLAQMKAAKEGVPRTQAPRTVSVLWACRSAAALYKVIGQGGSENLGRLGLFKVLRMWGKQRQQIYADFAVRCQALQRAHVRDWSQ
ncbi:hypothetical protein AK812_SmicGene38356 [Symbiodinium microadriaticum]|uniref:Uncharacterized protein n=1 Tax=Symbiodinium microadriaticum TaxID=2951 RepID=A0A1Q9CDZ5_SYMMI|nr:hypothetical protein AK812_SmicGene38356 [Symbiodinium microadriaticum]